MPIQQNILMEKYNAIVNLCMQSRAYYRHTFCGTKNKGQYLKVVTRKGMYFNPDEARVIDSFVTLIAGANRTISLNPQKGNLTVTLY
jgi:hypothetical protein